MRTTRKTFKVDEATLKALGELKTAFDIRTNAQVIRRALAFARVAARLCEKIGDDHVLRMIDGDGREQEILLNG